MRRLLQPLVAHFRSGPNVAPRLPGLLAQNLLDSLFGVQAVYRARRRIGAAPPAHRSHDAKVVPLRTINYAAPDGTGNEPQALLAAISLSAFVATLLISLVIKLCIV